MYDVARLFEGTPEVDGPESNPLVLAMLKLRVRGIGHALGRRATLDGWPTDDGTPWCGAAMQWWAYHCRLPIPPDPLRARQWLTVGRSIPWADAEMGNDYAVLSRGDYRPGPGVLDAPGHVGLYAGHAGGQVILLGGNQSDAITRETFPTSRVIGLRRLEW